MGRYWNETKGDLNVWPVVRDSIIGVFAIIAAGMAGCPMYNVWQQGLSGQAALARATQDRQIKVQEAQAKLDSASLLSQAEVIRAKGVSSANSIIGDSLKNNEAYLRYMWINSLETGNNQVIYVPTEAGLPILEAGKRVANAQ